MSDRIKTFLAVLTFISALVLPLIGLFIGWWQWDVETGFFLMAGTFLVLSIMAGLLLLAVKDLSWVSVYLPYIFGSVYGFLPDTIPFSIDDAAATTAGAIFTFILSLRKQPGTPRWVLLPLLGAGIYALLGGAIPGPVDEFLVDIVAMILTWMGTRQKVLAESREPESR